jgi:hypothetical protein
MDSLFAAYILLPREVTAIIAAGRRLPWHRGSNASNRNSPGLLRSQPVSMEPRQ